jgi:hypothetical protein
MIETICKLARGPQLLRCQRPAGSLQFKVQFVLAGARHKDSAPTLGDKALISCNAPTEASVLTCESPRRQTKYLSQFDLRRMTLRAEALSTDKQTRLISNAQ